MYKVCMQDSYIDLISMHSLLQFSPRTNILFQWAHLDKSSSLTKATGSSLRAANLPENLRKFCEQTSFKPHGSTFRQVIHHCSWIKWHCYAHALMQHRSDQSTDTPLKPPVITLHTKSSPADSWWGGCDAKGNPTICMIPNGLELFFIFI